MNKKIITLLAAVGLTFGIGAGTASAAGSTWYLTPGQGTYFNDPGVSAGRFLDGWGWLTNTAINVDIWTTAGSYRIWMGVECPFGSVVTETPAPGTRLGLWTTACPGGGAASRGAASIDDNDNI